MVLGPEDLVMTKNSKGGTLIAGFPLDTLASSNGAPAMKLHGGGSKNPVRLEGLAIPSSLALSSPSPVRRYQEVDGGIAQEGIFDQLTALAGPPRPTRRGGRATRRPKQARGGRGRLTRKR